MYKISADTLFMGQNLVFVPECHSTNSLAFELTQKGIAPEGTLIITSHQTKGRGQRGNTWQSEAGKNLTFSIVLMPQFMQASDQFQLNQAVTLGICETLQSLSFQRVKIKWPNDIMIDSKKVCGILIENSLAQNTLSQSIIGIGLNVNQVKFEMQTATALALEAGHTFDLNLLLNQLIQSIEKRYLQLRAGRAIELNNEYHTNLYWLHEEHVFESSEGTLTGVLSGIASDGRLRIQTERGERLFSLKEIRFVQ